MSNISSSESEQKNCIVCKVSHTLNYDHYGCKSVCSSCRNFFRRAVHSDQFSNFECKIRFENGIVTNCVIDSKNRKSCKKCRFKKCLDAGMKPNWVTCVNSGCPVSFISCYLLVLHESPKSVLLVFDIVINTQVQRSKDCNLPID